jgi:outer membrane protein
MTVKQLTLMFLLAALPTLAFAQDSSLSLPNALARVTFGPDWQTADLNYASSQRALDSARASTGLRVNGGADYGLSQRTDISSDANQTATLKADASLAVLPWGAGFDAVRSAERNLSKAGLDRRDQRNQIIINTCTQYFALRSSQTDLELASSTLKWREAQLEVGQKQFANGQINRETLSGQQVNLENAKLNLEQAQNTLEINRLTLANALALESRALGEPSSVPSEPNLPSEKLETLVLQATSRRSDVQKAKIALEQAQDDLSSAQRDRLLPNASLNLGLGQQYSAQGSASVQGAQLNAGLNFQTGNASLSVSAPVYASSIPANATTATTFSLSASFSLPIINPSGDAKIDSANRNLEAARASLESSKRSAELDVKNQYFNLVTAKNRVKVARVSQTQSAQNLETFEAKFKAGSATKLDLENAQIQKRQADRDLESQIATAQVAGLKLQQALGLELGVSDAR